MVQLNAKLKTELKPTAISYLSLQAQSEYSTRIHVHIAGVNDEVNQNIGRILGAINRKIYNDTIKHKILRYKRDIKA